MIPCSLQHLVPDIPDNLSCIGAQRTHNHLSFVLLHMNASTSTVTENMLCTVFLYTFLPFVKK